VSQLRSYNGTFWCDVRH
jgi:hypothetical protein